MNDARRSEETPIRISISVRGSALLTGFRSLLDAEDDIEVAGASESDQLPLGAEASVVVVDCALERLTAALLAGRIVRDASRILLVEEEPADSLLYEALRAGVRGLVVRDGPVAEIVRAIRAVDAGRVWLDPAVAERVLSVVGGPGPAVLENSALTPREREVLEYLADGLSNTEIAARLSVARRTVKYHVSHVLEKLGARDRAQAVAMLYRAGYRSVGRAG